MDARMQSTQSIPNQFQTWDYYVADGIVPILEGSQEESQTAMIAAYLQKGTIPQLPETGIPWVEFFTGQVQFNEVDGAIKNALNQVGLTQFYPTYDLVNDNLIATVTK